MTGAFEGLELVCPSCRGPVKATPEAFTCSRCGVSYPVVAGIPDFRVVPDPWIDLEADRAKGIRLERETEGQDFEAVVRAYWAMTPDTPREAAERFISHVLGAERRSREWLDSITGPTDHRHPARWLDIGCGTADLAVAAWPGAEVVGIDVAFRWLVVARRRLVASGVPVRLVCCNAEALPFPDASFDRALSLGMIEHATSSQAALRESRRVLRSGATLQVRTVNRYSLLAEPHVGVWGTGWLPRRWADRYVRWRTGQGYLHHDPLSAGRLARELRQAGFRAVGVESAAVLPSERKRLGRSLARLIPAYEFVRRSRILGRVIRAIAPLLEGHGVAA